MSNLLQLIGKDLQRIGVQTKVCFKTSDLIGFLEELYVKVEKEVKHHRKINEQLYDLIDKKVIIDKAIRALKNPLASAVIYGC